MPRIKTYKWDRIRTVDDFVKCENRENIYHGAVLDVKTSSKLTDEALNELKGKKGSAFCRNKLFVERLFYNRFYV